MVDIELLAWFESHAKPFLEAYAPERVQSLKSEATRLAQLNGLPTETMVCCLGSAGVGKSTLINALVAGDRQVLPAGGIGPLTALATTVRYSAQRRFSVRYHKPRFLWQIVLPLTAAAARARRETPLPVQAAAGTPESWDLAAPAELDEEITSEDLRSAEQDAAGEGEEGRTRIGEFARMARQLVTGGQFAEADDAYLVDALRWALGASPLFGHVPRPDDEPRLRRLRAALELAKKGTTYVREEAGDSREFLRDLEDHAAKALAPLISEIEVGWPSDLLKSGLVIVDLPGVGVASDVYRAKTQAYVRDQARAVILVLDRAGVTEAVLDSVRSSGYWNRLVGAAYDPEADPCALVVAVTKVDEVAEAEFEKYLDLPREERPRKADLYAQKVQEMVQGIRSQTATQLASLQDSSNSDLAEARAAARDQLLGHLQVHPISAPDYRRILADDDDDRPRIARDVDGTGIPGLSSALRQLANDLQTRQAESVAKVRDRLVRGLVGELAILESQWQGEQRVAEEAERLRRDLDEAVRPWREELANRQGGFREFLQAVMAEKIAGLVIEARSAAEEEITSYLQELQHCHWATLRAAVRRGGTWVGSRQIDLPADIGDRFQEPMAGVWGMRLLRDIRKRTGVYAGDCVTHVGRVCDWARGQGSRVNPAILQRQEERIADQAAQLKQVGKEAADELRAVVRSELQRAIAGPIRKRCEQFIENGDDIGPGVKQRILGLFRELARESARAAEQPARRILERRFEEVRSQIDVAFAEWSDPIAETVDAIASSNEQRMRRADVKRRAKVLAELTLVREAMPVHAAAALGTPITPAAVA